MPAYPVLAYYAHGRQRRCQEDPVSLPSSRLEKTTRSSPHHMAQHHPTGSETSPPYVPRSSRFGSEPPSVEDDVDVWCYAILELHARNDDDYSTSPDHTTLPTQHFQLSVLLCSWSTVWNSLLDSLHDPAFTSNSFRQSLKTHRYYSTQTVQ